MYDAKRQKMQFSNFFSPVKSTISDIVDLHQTAVLSWVYIVRKCRFRQLKD